jgi:elongation factor G
MQPLQRSLDYAQVAEDPLCALAFKVAHDRQRGALVYLRIYTGLLQRRQVLKLAKGSANSSTVSFDPSLASAAPSSKSEQSHFKERATHILRPFADELIPVEEAPRGSIVVAVGLKHARTGDTLVLEKGALGGSKASGVASASLEGIDIPAPVFALSISPKDSSKARELESALAIMSRDDPSLVVGVDPDTEQLLIEGMGELHLDVACSRLVSEFNIDVATGRVRIAYREALVEPMVLENFCYDRMNETETKRLFAGLSVEFTPRPLAASGVHGMDSCSVALSPQARKDLHNNAEWASALQEGLTSACLRGPRHGFPLVGMDVTVTACKADAPGHGDTNPQALRNAAEALVLHAGKSAEVLLLQPMMDVEITTPNDHLGTVLSDLTVSRVATIREVVTTGEGLAARTAVYCDVPLANLLGYSTDLRSITSGEGQFSMHYTHHAEIDALPDDEEGSAGTGAGATKKVRGEEGTEHRDREATREAEEAEMLK